MRALRRFDRGLARGEAFIAALVLLSMVVVAAAQALLRNLVQLEVSWANDLLMHFSWADPLLQKGTLWVAFLGASLATHEDKHIAIDVLQRVAPPRVRSLMRAVVGMVAAVVCFLLAQVFRMSVLNNAADIPLDFSVLGATGQAVHICGASASAIADAGLERPGAFCAVRQALAAIGSPVSTPINALELIVPAMFFLMGVRFVFKGLGSLADIVSPPAADADADADAPAEGGGS